MYPFQGIRGNTIAGMILSLGVASAMSGGAILYLDPPTPISTTITPFGPDNGMGFPYDPDGHADAHGDGAGCPLYPWEMDLYQPAHPSQFATGRVSFSLTVKDEVIAYPLMTISVMPGESLLFTAQRGPTTGQLMAATLHGTLDTLDGDRWRWTAPREQGLYCIRVVDTLGRESININAFVLEPYDGGESLNGYRIGQYQPQALGGDPDYERPRGFIEVTPQLEDTWVSPHFQLRQFVCKQAGGYPKYLALRTRLLLKLEVLLEDLQSRGVDATSFYVVSGYRTPWYNAQIGNASTYSRHTYGDACDFLVDVNRDGVFDDLDRDGGVGSGDVYRLRDLVDQLEAKAPNRFLVGGFGVYEPVPGERGPFAHIDTRGNAARWIVRPGDKEEEDSTENVTEEDSLLIDQDSLKALDSTLVPDKRKRGDQKKPIDGLPAEDALPPLKQEEIIQGPDTFPEDDTEGGGGDGSGGKGGGDGDPNGKKE